MLVAILLCNKKVLISQPKSGQLLCRNTHTHMVTLDSHSRFSSLLCFRTHILIDLHTVTHDSSTTSQLHSSLSLHFSLSLSSFSPSSVSNTHTHTHTHMYAHKGMYARVCTHTHICTHTHTHTHTHFTHKARHILSLSSFARQIWGHSGDPAAVSARPSGSQSTSALLRSQFSPHRSCNVPYPRRSSAVHTGKSAPWLWFGSERCRGPVVGCSGIPKAAGRGVTNRYR